jgi:hypothetical protein
MDGNTLATMAKRLEADEESGLPIISEIEDANRALTATAGLIENAAMRLLAAFA